VEQRRRRPSGEPPPLPRELNRTGLSWAALAGGVVVFWILFLLTKGAIATPFERLDQWILERVADLRSSRLTSLMRGVHALGSDWTLRLPGWAAVLVPLLFKRFRHAIVFLSSVLIVRGVIATITVLIPRPRPTGIPILGSWDGFSHPSRPIALLAVTLLGMSYALVPQGRWRQGAKWVTGAAVVALGIARVYLAVDHPTDVVIGAIIGVAVPLVVFRLFAPNEAFPVTYRRGRSAHLEVDERRCEAIRVALKEQLGLTMLRAAPFGLGGSAGSTPLRMEMAAGDSGTFLFGKLYAATHLRADRWYKLGRTLLYGRLEDEASFNTVRRLVQYEDYLLRLMQDAGIPSALPYGFVEITPEREYLLVTEFLDGAVEIKDAEVDDGLIDDALGVVRKLWDAGLAHRDIKPSNVLVHEGRIALIDVAFGEARPSPWRQAVDLANMMLTLALRTDAPRVYERALEVFTKEEIAEAFAATRGVTSPTQLRSLLGAQSRDLVAEFRRLAPPRAPITIQRWSLRRIGLLTGVCCGTLFATMLLWGLLQTARLL
jgi:membrane-associated phospholipid phosphatase/tRNA A-37 threonylcarbamoyl transferase component Bud32